MLINTKELKYNFVFLFAYQDYWKAILGEELYNGKQTRVYRTAFEGSTLMQTLFHYHWAYSLNCKIRMPLKWLWFERMYHQDFNNDLPICFVFMGGNNIRFDSGFCKYIKKKDPRNRIVILHNDLISKHCAGYKYADIREKADLAITYDKSEAEKYGIAYFQETTYSKLVQEPENVSFEYDVYFLGSAKDRLEKIHESFNYLRQNGFKCKFIVTGVPEEKRIEGIEYSNGISYEQNLKYVINSRVLLEIIQGGSFDITTRALEAIAYRRKFITDCPLDLGSYFNEHQLLRFEKVQEINPDFILREFKPEMFDPRIDLNPMKRLYFIQEKLEKNR